MSGAFGNLNNAAMLAMRDRQRDSDPISGFLNEEESRDAFANVVF